MIASLWIFTTVAAAGAQSLRNALQRGLTSSLGTLGATNVRFLFGLPFAILFLAVLVVATGDRPHPVPAFWAWAAAGGVGQILATACMLAAMRDRSFLVTIALTKTEPVQVALFSLAFLGEVPTGTLITAIAIATLGVMVLSWPKRRPTAVDEPRATLFLRLRPALLGVASGGFFALAAVFFKAGIRATHSGGFLVDASATLVASLAVQTALLTGWLALRAPAVLGATLREWRPSIGAGFLGAAASQLWFVGFAIAPVAAVRTLGLVEILFAQALSRGLMKERPSARDLLGVLLLILGVLFVLRS
ncbi:MAG: EamA family transporter [Hyphomicrobiales bacterium]|nr:EamA family transporter [Hyphomicrobiales bacterium]